MRLDALLAALCIVAGFGLGYALDEAPDDTLSRELGRLSERRGPEPDGARAMSVAADALEMTDTPLQIQPAADTAAPSMPVAAPPVAQPAPQAAAPTAAPGFGVWTSRFGQTRQASDGMEVPAAAPTRAFGLTEGEMAELMRRAREAAEQQPPLKVTPNSEIVAEPMNGFQELLRQRRGAQR